MQNEEMPTEGPVQPESESAGEVEGGEGSQSPTGGGTPQGPPSPEGAQEVTPQGPWVLILGVVVILAGLAFLYFAFLRPTPVDENAPPALVEQRSGLQGLIQTTKGFYEFTQADVDSFEGFSDLNCTPATMLPGTHYYYTDTEMTVRNIIDRIEPEVGNQMILAFWSPGETKITTDRGYFVAPQGYFKTYEDDPQVGTRLLGDDQKIPANRGFAVILRRGTRGCLKTEQTKPSAFYSHLEGAESGWLAVPLDQCSSLDSVKDRMKALWAQSGVNKFEKIAPESWATACLFPDYYMVWLKLGTGVAGPPNLATSTKEDSDGDKFVNPGQAVTYTIILKNTGGVKATGVTVDDTLDSDLENLTVIGKNSCGTSVSDTSVANPPVLNLDNVEVDVDTDCVISFTADVKAGTANETKVNNTATVGAAAEGGSGASLISPELTVLVEAPEETLPAEKPVVSNVVVNPATFAPGETTRITCTVEGDYESVSLTITSGTYLESSLLSASVLAASGFDFGGSDSDIFDISGLDSGVIDALGSAASIYSETKTSAEGCDFTWNGKNNFAQDLVGENEIKIVAVNADGVESDPATGLVVVDGALDFSDIDLGELDTSGFFDGIDAPNTPDFGLPFDLFTSSSGPTSAKFLDGPVVIPEAIKVYKLKGEQSTPDIRGEQQRFYYAVDKPTDVVLTIWDSTDKIVYQEKKTVLEQHTGLDKELFFEWYGEKALKVTNQTIPKDYILPSGTYKYKMFLNSENFEDGTFTVVPSFIHPSMFDDIPYDYIEFARMVEPFDPKADNIGYYRIAYWINGADREVKMKLSILQNGVEVVPSTDATLPTADSEKRYMAALLWAYDLSPGTYTARLEITNQDDFGYYSSSDRIEKDFTIANKATFREVSTGCRDGEFTVGDCPPYSTESRHTDKFTGEFVRDSDPSLPCEIDQRCRFKLNILSYAIYGTEVNYKLIMNNFVRHKTSDITLNDSTDYYMDIQAKVKSGDHITICLSEGKYDIVCDTPTAYVRNYDVVVPPESVPDPYYE